MALTDVQPETTVEVVVTETAVEPVRVEDAGRPPPRDKLPLTQPVLTASQRRSIERSLTDPAEAARAQFRKNTGDKSSEGRKRSLQNIERIQPMNQTQANGDTTTNQLPEVPRNEQTAMQQFASMPKLQVAKNAAIFAGVTGTVVGLGYGIVWLAKRYVFKTAAPVAA